MISAVPTLIHFSVRAVGNISEGLKGRDISHPFRDFLFTGIGFIVVFIYIIGQVRQIPLNQRPKITQKNCGKIRS